MNKFTTDILIIGGGSAGMSAALAAASNNDRKIILVDDNPMLGGQIWRAELGKIKSKQARDLIGRLDAGNIQIFNGTQFIAATGENSALFESSIGSTEIRFEKLILATGARERFLPFENWTLQNVFGAGGLQALVKCGFSVEKKRIVISGSGPLLIAVAEYLKSKGAEIVLIAEQTPANKLNKFAARLIFHPKKLFEGLKLRAKLLGVRYYTNAFVAAAEGNEKLESVTLVRNGIPERIECDLLACGYHLVPNIEAAQMLGCEIKNGIVVVDDYQKTSIKNIFCAGEPTGIGGVDLSLIEGEIAGLSAIGEKTAAARLFGKRRKLQKFSDSLNDAFVLRPELKKLSSANTIVCRCEDVRFAELTNYNDFREAKLQTRCGMGACQGRICGSAVEFIFGWDNRSIRPPLFPVKLGNLAE